MSCCTETQNSDRVTHSGGNDFRGSNNRTLQSKDAFSVLRSNTKKARLAGGE